MNSHKIITVILAGGSGTRLWPLSRELTPKQLINIGGDDSLLQKTLDRAYLLSKEKPIILTNKKIYDQIDKSMLKNDVNFLLEPEPKNTAPAIALATDAALKLDSNPILVILSADHHIDNKQFIPYIKKAIGTAETTGRVVLMGIKPTRPETGYGYIKLGGKIDKNSFGIAEFTEKPDKATAEKYLKDGDYMWNAGIFIAPAKTLKTEIEKYMPKLAKVFSESNKENLFKSLEPISIDFGLLEKTDKIAVVPTDAIWNDLGNWGAIYDISTLDVNGNSLEGDIVNRDTTGSLILARGQRRVATIGLKNLVIIDTEDVTLICDKDRTQEVKNIVDMIKQEPNNKDHIEHKTMHRPWGRYTVLDEGEGFKVKFIHVAPGGKLSLQKHLHRSEHWVVVKGTARITVDDKTSDFGPNESTFVPLGSIHRLENNGDTELTIVEVATGERIDENDIVRLDDIYRRSS